MERVVDQHRIVRPDVPGQADRAVIRGDRFDRQQIKPPGKAGSDLKGMGAGRPVGAVVFVDVGQAASRA